MWFKMSQKISLFWFAIPLPHTSKQKETYISQLEKDFYMLKGMIIWHCKYMHSLFLDKETPDTDFTDEVVVM